MSRSQTRAGCGTPRRPGGLRSLGQVAGWGRESSRKGSVGQHLLQAPLCLCRSPSLAEVARAPLSPHLTRELRGSISRGELGGSMSGGSSTFTGSLAARLPLRAATTPGALSLPQGSLQEHEGVRCGPGWERRGDQYTHGSRRPCRAPSRPWVPGGVLLAHYPSSTASSRAGILAPTVTVAHPAGSKLSAHRGGLSPRAVPPGTAL